LYIDKQNLSNGYRYQQTLSALFIVLLMEAMAFCATWQLPKCLLQGSDE